MESSGEALEGGRERQLARGRLEKLKEKGLGLEQKQGESAKKGDRTGTREVIRGGSLEAPQQARPALVLRHSCS